MSKDLAPLDLPPACGSLGPCGHWCSGLRGHTMIVGVVTDKHTCNQLGCGWWTEDER